MKAILSIKRFAASLVTRHLCISSSGDIKSKFQRAVNAVTSSNSINPDDSTKLKLYALFKQSEKGQCQGSRPSFFDIVGRAKYDAWDQLGDMSKEDAMRNYTSTVETIINGNLPADDNTNQSELIVNKTKAISDKPPIDKKYLSMEEIIFPKKVGQPSLDESNYSSLVTSMTSEGIVNLKLNRTKKGNSFNMTLLNEFFDVFQQLKRQKSIKVVILSGCL